MTDGRRDAQFLLPLADERVDVTLAWLDLAAWILPLRRERLGLGAEPDEYAVVGVDGEAGNDTEPAHATTSASVGGGG